MQKDVRELIDEATLGYTLTFVEDINKHGLQNKIITNTEWKKSKEEIASAVSGLVIESNWNPCNLAEKLLVTGGDWLAKILDWDLIEKHLKATFGNYMLGINAILPSHDDSDTHLLHTVLNMLSNLTTKKDRSKYINSVLTGMKNISDSKITHIVQDNVLLDSILALFPFSHFHELENTKMGLSLKTMNDWHNVIGRHHQWS
ncbi:hypothetical protein L210DRAFT_933217 [Boletus edulis BED1]|uniref:Uncharacterized protein n=1 Tax=Boletus edulis BED1 TaxID=1328754 RepID=A0AAD4BYH6_BOLED|nr:hypothetical protein L210DRAFT_933217 [Boletus edulis BED1]